MAADSTQGSSRAGERFNGPARPLDAGEDRALRRRVLASLRPHLTVPVYAFQAARARLFPLDKLHACTPTTGLIADVGSGHGLISQYLARAAPARSLLSYEPDERRAAAARAAAADLPNLEVRQQLFDAGPAELSAVLIIGVLLLLSDETCRSLLRAARSRLLPGGVLVIDDVPAEPKVPRWVHEFHLARERFLGKIAFTRGEGLVLRTRARWAELLDEAGFAPPTEIDAPIWMHSSVMMVARTRG